MDPHRLRLLRELGDRGSVSAVAESLRVSPSAVSQQLALLQSEARVPLTEREGRRCVLTPAGRALAAAGVSVAKALAEADAAVDRFLESGVEPVRVCAFHSAALALFGRLLAARGCDDAELQLADEDVAGQEFPRLTADYDLVIAHRLPHQPDWPTERVSVVPILTEPIDVVMRPLHPLAAKQILKPEDLADQAWVAVHAGFPLRGVLDQIAGSAGASAKVIHEVNEFSVVAEILRSSDALALMPRIARLHLEQSVERREVRGVRLQRRIEVLARPENLERSAVKRVLGLIHRVASSYVAAHHSER